MVYGSAQPGKLKKCFYLMIYPHQCRGPRLYKMIDQMVLCIFSFCNHSHCFQINYFISSKCRDLQNGFRPQAYLCKKKNKKIQDKLGLSCAKLSTAQVSYHQLGVTHQLGLLELKAYVRYSLKSTDTAVCMKQFTLEL